MALTDDDILTNHPELTYEMTHDDDFGLITFDIAGLHHCDVLTPSEIRADYMSMPFKRWILRSVEPKWRKFVGDGYQVKPHSYMGLNNLELIATRPDLPKHSGEICHAQHIDPQDMFMTEYQARAVDSGLPSCCFLI